jgi:FKBP-type peptidyl-prolyl cis-trans isomerase
MVNKGESSMRSCCVWILGGLMGVSLVGCEDPGPIVPTTPPGASIPRKDPDPEAAQAQGEMAAPAITSESAPVKAIEYTPALPTAKGETKTTKHGVKYETVKEGTGPELKPGQSGRFLYEGKLEDGTVFDSTAPKNEPRIFSIGTGQMTQGWEEAIPGMKVGETRKLTVPPAAAYGASGRPPKIPPNATLIFEVELVAVL